METSLKAIDTNYKGYLFRSRLEARYAIVFDELGWKWEYESEGYQLKSGWYLPDFYFPDLGLFAEVKPRGLNKNEMGRCLELSKGTYKTRHGETRTFDVLLLQGELENKAFTFLSKGDMGFTAVLMPYWDEFYPYFYTAYCGEETGYGMPEAFAKAKQARFEFLNNTKVQPAYRKPEPNLSQVDSLFAPEKPTTPPTKKILPSFKDLMKRVEEIKQGCETPITPPAKKLSKLPSLRELNTKINSIKNRNDF